MATIGIGDSRNWREFAEDALREHAQILAVGEGVYWRAYLLMLAGNSEQAERDFRLVAESNLASRCVQEARAFSELMAHERHKDDDKLRRGLADVPPHVIDSIGVLRMRYAHVFASERRRAMVGEQFPEAENLRLDASLVEGAVGISRQRISLVAVAMDLCCRKSLAAASRIAKSVENVKASAIGVIGLVKLSGEVPDLERWGESMVADTDRLPSRTVSLQETRDFLADKEKLERLGIKFRVVAVRRRYMGVDIGVSILLIVYVVASDGELRFVSEASTEADLTAIDAAIVGVANGPR